MMKDKILQRLLFCLLILGLGSAARADVIELENGSRIVGEITQIDKNKVTVKTDFAGPLEIDLAKILTYSTDQPRIVSFSGQEDISGKIIYTKSQTRVEMANGKVHVTSAPPALVRPEGAPDPAKRRWSYEVGMDVVGKTGSVEHISAGLRSQAKLQGPGDRLLLYLRYFYMKDDNVESDFQVVGGVDFESYFKEKHSFYARMELEKDRIRKIDFRATGAAGYGYYFLKKPHHTLRVRAGLMARHESLRDEASDLTAGIDLGVSHMYRFTNAWKVMNDITYTPGFEEYRNYRIYHESAFEIPLVASETWKFRLGMSNDYNSRPAVDREYLDTTYFARLVFSWK
jgi:putative salt-induced outer membrane protein YdiY